MDWCVHYISTNSHPHSHSHWHPHPHPPTRMRKTKSKMRNKWKVQRQQNCSKLLSRMAQTSMFLLPSSPSLSLLIYLSPSYRQLRLTKTYRKSNNCLWVQWNMALAPLCRQLMYSSCQTQIPDPGSRAQSRCATAGGSMWGLEGSYSGFAWFNQ